MGLELIDYVCLGLLAGSALVGLVACLWQHQPYIAMMIGGAGLMTIGLIVNLHVLSLFYMNSEMYALFGYFPDYAYNVLQFIGLGVFLLGALATGFRGNALLGRFLDTTFSKRSDADLKQSARYPSAT